VIRHDLLTMGVPVAEKAIRTVAVYLGILVLLRLAGKRDLAQLNSFDLVVLLLLSNVVQNAVIGDDNSLAGGLLGAVVLVVGNATLVRVLRRSERAIKLFEGTPTTLVSDGRIDDHALFVQGLRKGDVLNAIRRQGANTVEEVDEAVLEPGGAIVVDLKREAENATRADIERVEAKLDAILAALPATP
jgi:uncharacterized membrane protein YcaP (DUF421 family)